MGWRHGGGAVNHIVRYFARDVARSFGRTGGSGSWAGEESWAVSDDYVSHDIDLPVFVDDLEPLTIDIADQVLEDSWADMDALIDDVDYSVGLQVELDTQPIEWNDDW